MAVFATIAAWVATSLSVSLFTAQIITAVAVSAALYGVQALLFKPPKLKTPDYQSVVNQSTGNRMRGYGRVKAGGIRAYFWASAGKLYQVVMMHHGRVDAFEEVFVGSDKVVFGSGTTVTYKGKTTLVAMHRAFGADTQPADPLLSFDFRLRGVAYISAIFTAPKPEYFPETFPEGVMTPIRAVLRLSRVYDPRAVGQSHADPSTWAYSDNAALCILDYLTHPDGYRLTLNDIDIPSFIAMANICNEAVPLKAGGTEPRYRLWGMYSLNDEPRQVLVRMLSACDGELVQLAEDNGKVALRGGKWHAPTVTIENDHILGFQFEGGADRLSAFNKLKIIYTDQAHDFQATEAQPIEDFADQDRRGVIEDDFTVDMCPSPSQAQRLAKIFIAKRNPQWRGTISVQSVGLQALGERTIRVKIDELEMDETFLVTGFSINAETKAVDINITSLNASAYAWDAATEEGDPPISVDRGEGVVIPTPEGLSLYISTRLINQGTEAAVVVAEVNAPVREDLILDAQIRQLPSGAFGAMQRQEAWVAESGVVEDGAEYEVRARFINAASSAGPWSETETILAIANPTEPAAPTGFSTTLSGSNVNLVWTNPTTNFYKARIFRGTSSTFSGSTAIVTLSGVAGSPGSYVDAPGSGTFYYWVVALNNSNVPSTPAGPESETIP